MPSQLCPQAKPFFPVGSEAKPVVKSVQKTTQKTTEITREELITNVAGLLDEIIAEKGTNFTQVSEIPDMTVFHAKKLAPISLRDYLLRFGKNTECHEDAFIYALIYLDRCADNIEDFSLDSFNILRLILISMVTGIKFYDDTYYKNSFYARVGGVSVQEFNKLEQEYLCNYVDFNLYVDDETYTSYYDDIVKFNQAKVEKSGEGQSLSKHWEKIEYFNFFHHFFFSLLLAFNLIPPHTSIPLNPPLHWTQIMRTHTYRARLPVIY